MTDDRKNRRRPEGGGGTAPGAAAPDRFLAVDARLEELSPRHRALLFERGPRDEQELALDTERLMAEVRRDGDRALHRMARDLDGAGLRSLEVPRERWKAALAALDPGLRDALARASRNLAVFHRAQVPDELQVEVEPGVRLGRRAVPLGRVGVYAPGGSAAYPSSVLMGVVPARAAGVGEVVVCSPPGPSGEPPAAVLAACELAKADRLFAAGGAGAVAAMTWGTESVPRVDAVVGPGNRWVTEAKRQVAGRVRIDALAGPSEVLVVAGPGADPERVAGELVAQAEHDPDAAVAAVAWDERLLAGVREALVRRTALAARRGVVERALSGRGALVLAASREEALAFAREYAPEHLALYTDDPRRDAGEQDTAGTVFLGQASSVVFGDYLTGANHVLPTGGRARSFSGLSALDFVRFVTWQELSGEAAAGMARDAAVTALAEGLPAHADAARDRAPEAPSRTGRETAGGWGRSP